LFLHHILLTIAVLLSPHRYCPLLFLFFFNDTAPTEIYTLSLHDALPISMFLGVPLRVGTRTIGALAFRARRAFTPRDAEIAEARSEEHTSELQSRFDLVCRLLLEKKKKNQNVYSNDNTRSNKIDKTRNSH